MAFRTELSLHRHCPPSECACNVSYSAELLRNDGLWALMMALPSALSLQTTSCSEPTSVPCQLGAWPHPYGVLTPKAQQCHNIARSLWKSAQHAKSMP